MLQGSVLGPTIFNIYVADLPKIAKGKYATLLMFADDMTLYAFRDSEEEACKAVSVTLSELTSILSSRGPAMNADKTVGMLILPCLLRHQANTFGIFCDGAPISMVSKTRRYGR